MMLSFSISWFYEAIIVRIFYSLRERVQDKGEDNSTRIAQKAARVKDADDVT